MPDFQIDPVRLLEDAYASWVEVKGKDADKKPAAWVRKLSRKLFEVTINEELLGRVEDSERDLVRYALKLHEVAHIRYGTYFGRLYGTQLYKWLYNLMEDVRIEHLLRSEFPTMVKPFRALYSAMQDKLYANEKDKDAQAIIEDCNVLYRALRYAKGGEDHDVTQFVLPRLEVVKHSSTDSARVLATQVFAYLLAKHDLPVQVRIGTRVKVTKRGERSEEEQSDMDDAEFEASGSSSPYAAGKEGSGGITYMDSSHRDPRWDDVMVRHYHDSVQLADAMRRMLGRVVTIPAYEGDIMLQAVKQQQAYIDSYTSEVHMTSTRLSRAWPRVDCTLMVDQSGSMGAIQHQVSDMVIVIAAAIDMVKDCRLAVAGFGGPENNTRFIKQFGGPAWAGDYAPCAGGGTPMGECMKDVAESPFYKWRETARRVVVVVTDGMPDKWNTVRAALEMPFYDKAIIVPLMIGAYYREVPEYEVTFGRKVRFVVSAAEMASAVITAIGEEVLK